MIARRLVLVAVVGAAACKGGGAATPGDGGGIGWWLYQGGAVPAEFDLWLDDLAVASSRIGC